METLFTTSSRAVEGQPALALAAAFAEYEARLDTNVNSGVQIRSVVDPAVRGGRVHGYQVEIDPGDRAWSGGIPPGRRRTRPVREEDGCRGVLFRCWCAGGREKTYGSPVSEVRAAPRWVSVTGTRAPVAEHTHASVEVPAFVRPNAGATAVSNICID
jgi:hypothetical protein